MDLLTRMLVKNFTLADLDKAMMEQFRGSPVHSGVRVNEETALRFTTVWTCIRILAETLGSLPFEVFRNLPGGGREEAEDHPVHALIKSAPNPDMVSQTWRETMQGHIAASGNGYSLLTLNGRGQPVDIYPWDWHQMRPVRNKNTGLLEYELRDRGKPEIWPAERVLHIPGLGYDGIEGYSVISLAREAIGIGLAMTEFSARFYGQGMNVGGIIETQGELSPTARKELQEFYDQQGAGLANSWRPLILEFGQKWSRIPMPLKDAQFVEGFKLTDAQTAGIFRIPLHMVNELDRATHSNVEHLFLQFVQLTMLPWATRWEQACNRRLFTRREREQGYYVKFNFSALLRGDAKSRAEALHIMRQDGVINADQWLALEDMNPQPGGIGQRHLTNGNMIPVDAAGVSQPKDRKHWTVNEMREADGLKPDPDGDVPLDEWLRRKQAAQGGE